MNTPKSALMLWNHGDLPEYPRFVAWAWQTLAENGHESCCGWWAEGPFLSCACGWQKTYLEKLYV